MPVSGRYTGCDLCQVACLALPWQSFGGQPMPAFSPDAARLSLELASTAYELDTDSWRAAGWRDISFQVDNALFSASAVSGEDGKSHPSSGDSYQRQAQALLKRKNPFSQIAGALRQRDGSDTCKAVIMLRPLSGRRYIVAIGFMGTGKRIYDWFSNFRLSCEDGSHLGFLQLTRQFENNCDKIYFPETAAELGLNKLTLKDVLIECRRPHSRFRVWMAGHSQGGAVMQLFAYRAVKGGVLMRNLLGYGFASPSALFDAPACDLGGFPLFHIINADDVTPRVGAALHIGRCRVLIPDAAMRTVCYRAGLGNPAFLPMLLLLHTIRDSAAAFLSMVGFLRALQNRPDEETASLLPEVFSRFLPDKWTASLSGRLDGLLRHLIRQTEKGYFLASGRDTVPPAELERLTRRCALLMDQYGAKSCVQALGSALGLPHKLRGPMDDMRSYQFIVNHRLNQLLQKVWLPPVMISEGMPRRSPRRLPGGRCARYAAERNRRMRHGRRKAP